MLRDLSEYRSMFLMPALKRRLTQHLESWPREELTPWSSRPIHSCWPSATNLFGSLRSTRFLQSTFYASSLMLADCRRLMTTPGVGPVVSLTYRATVDVPARFRKFQVRRGGVWADVCQVSIGRGRLGRQNIALWR